MKREYEQRFDVPLWVPTPSVRGYKAAMDGALWIPEGAEDPDPVAMYFPPYHYTEVPIAMGQLHFLGGSSIQFRDWEYGNPYIGQRIWSYEGFREFMQGNRRIPGGRVFR